MSKTEEEAIQLLRDTAASLEIIKKLVGPVPRPGIGQLNQAFDRVDIRLDDIKVFLSRHTD